MKGLLLKDLYMSFKYCRAFLLMVMVFLGASFLGEDNIFFILYPTMIAGVIPMTLLSYDERDKWTQYSRALPYTPAQLVSVKYLIGLLFGGTAFVISMGAAAVRMKLKGFFSIEEFFVFGVLLLVLGLLVPTFLLPFVFRFGVEKGRIAFYAAIGVICALGVLLTGIGFQTILPVDNPLVIGGICLVFLLLYGGSWRLSILFYRGREG